MYKRSNEERYHQNQGNSGTGRQAADEGMSPWNPMYPLVHPLGEFTQPFHPANIMRRSLDIETAYKVSEVKKDVPKSSEISSDNPGFYKFVDSSGEVTYIDENRESIKNVSKNLDSKESDSPMSRDSYRSSFSSYDSSSGGGGSSYD